MPPQIPSRCITCAMHSVAWRQWEHSPPSAFPLPPSGTLSNFVGEPGWDYGVDSPTGSLAPTIGGLRQQRICLAMPLLEIHLGCRVSVLRMAALHTLARISSGKLLDPRWHSYVVMERVIQYLHTSLHSYISSLCLTGLTLGYWPNIA